MSVEFGEAVSAYAASLLAARRMLDAATARLAGEYAADETLRSLPTPAFRLAEAEFDVPYVVDEVVTEEAPAPVPLGRRPVVTVPERELASLTRGVDEQVRARLNRVLDEYRGLSDLHRRAREDPDALRDRPIPRLEEITDTEVEALRGGASVAARGRLDRLLQDYRDLHASLEAAAEAAARGPRTRVLVRLDAAALAEAPADRVQRARLLFRDVLPVTVDVDGQPVVVPE